jgi:hypothetical protein
VARHLFIVARDAPDLFSYLSKEFSSEPDVTVILDRRQGERRSRNGRTAEAPGDTAEPAAERSNGSPAERRRTDRRLKAEIASQLATLGYAFVRLS